MSEKSTGTNAIGTALHEDLSVQISGERHYITAYHTFLNMFCSDYSQ